MGMEKIINMFGKVEGYIGLNAEYAHEIADFLEIYKRRAENLVNHNADLNNQLNKAESHIEMLEKQLAEKSEWISVEDRLPEEEGKYLVYQKGNVIVTSSYFLCKKNWFHHEVTHWMPLPKPPKPKEPTFKDKFLEMFPKAELNNFRVPVVCAGALFSYLKDNCNTSDCSYNGIEYQEKCYVCWNQPYFEEEGETDA